MFFGWTDPLNFYLASSVLWWTLTWITQPDSLTPLLPASALVTDQPAAGSCLRRNGPWWQVTLYLGADRGKGVSRAVRAEKKQRRWRNCVCVCVEGVQGEWGSFHRALSWVTGGTAVTLMVHTSTRGLESTQTGVERVPQECSGEETQLNYVYLSF